MATYPVPAPSIANNVISASRFLNSPTLVARRVQQLVDLRYVGGQLLRGREDAEGGAISYEQAESMFADAALEVVAPGGEYSLTTAQLGPAGLAKVAKYGKDTLVTDELVKRSNRANLRGTAVDRNLAKLANSAAAFVDQAVISTIASAVTQTAAAAAKWTVAGTTSILLDIQLAVAAITGNNQGYNPDTLLVDDTVWAYLSANATIANMMARENPSNAVYTGRFANLAGLDVVHVPVGNLPGGVNTNAWVLDSTMLGFIATEDLQDGYTRAGDIVETKSMRADENDAWRVRARANFVPVVTEPGAGYKITAVN